MVTDQSWTWAPLRGNENQTRFLTVGRDIEMNGSSLKCIVIALRKKRGLKRDGAQLKETTRHRRDEKRNEAHPSSIPNTVLVLRIVIPCTESIISRSRVDLVSDDPMKKEKEKNVNKTRRKLRTS